MWHLFLSTERNVLIVTNKSTCSDVLGSQALHHSYSCGLDLGRFPWAVPVVTAGHCLSFSLEGAAFVCWVSWVSFHAPCWWSCQNSAICAVLLAVQIRSDQEALGCAENICWASTEQPNSSGSGNWVHLGWSWAASWNQGGRHRKWSPCWCLRALCRGWSLCGAVRYQISVQRMELISIRKSSCYSHDAGSSAAPSDHTGNWECGIRGNQAECLPEDSLEILLQTCV